jgi:prolipoprotein diacylglyceryl transferase
VEYLAYIYWNARPELLNLGQFAIRWYGVLFALGILLGYWFVRWAYRVENKPETSLDTLLVYVVVGGVLGARLGHCLFYDPAYYLRHPLEILMIWKGGLASHGGVVGVLVALGLYSRRRPDQPFVWLLDRLVVPAGLTGSLIRVGNFFNSEILGKPTEVPWAVVFQQIDPVPRHPAQLYESIGYACIFALLFWLYSRWKSAAPPGALAGWFLMALFTLRFLVEFFKQPQASYEGGAPISVGQWLSIPFIAVGAWLVWRAFKYRARTASLLTRTPQ